MFGISTLNLSEKKRVFDHTIRFSTMNLFKIDTYTNFREKKCLDITMQSLNVTP